MTKYPNRDALYKAHDIYRDAMREFIPSATPEKLISTVLDREPVDNIKASIDIGNIPHLLRSLWNEVFRELFDRRDIDIRSSTGVIRDGRNKSWAHPGTEDVSIEFTRTHLFLIADVLSEIGKQDEENKVEEIRDQLFSDKISDISNRLEEVERENAAYKKRMQTVPDQLEVTKAEKAKYEKALKTASNQLATLKRTNAQLEKRLEVTTTRLEDVEAELTACKKDLANTLRQLEGKNAGKTEYLSLGERLELLKSNGKTTTSRREHLSLDEPPARALRELEKGETEEERVEIAKKVAELRLNPDASGKMSWKNIRKEVLLTNDEFHSNIRISDYYKEIMLERLGNLIDEGWVYNGCLNILCGFDVPEEFVERMESNKATAKIGESPSYRGNTQKPRKSQRKWRRPGAVAALRTPVEIRQAEAKIAKILNPREKTRLERELREAKQAVYGSEI